MKTKTFDGAKLRPKPKRCGTCAHGGEHFKLPSGTHLHCGHPEIADTPYARESAWETLREWYSTCHRWEERK
jgi:hypothetical protein